MTGQPARKIRTFLPSDLAQAQRLFASGLMEFAGEFEDGVRRYVDHALQDDMADISAHYLSHPRSNFWVVESGGPAVGPGVGIVGIVGIQPKEREQDAELRRMSVSSSIRRQGIGRRLLETTEEFCREKGYRRIFLSTVEILQPALAMYRRFGYTTLREEPYGDPPNRTMIVHHLVKELDAAT